VVMATGGAALLVLVRRRGDMFEQGGPS